MRRSTFVENAENGTFSTDYDVKSGPALNISAGAAGLAQHRRWRRRHALLEDHADRLDAHRCRTRSSSIAPRSVSGDVGGLEREELAVHVQARAMFTPKPNIQAMVFGGPSFFSVKQGIVNDFEITEAYPYDTATFSRG